MKIPHSLRDISIFADLTDQQLEPVMRASRDVKVHKNGNVFMLGDPSDSTFFLKEGRIKISKINRDGRKLTIDIIEPGEVFGELSLSGERVRRTFAEAVEAAFCWEIRTKSLEEVLTLRPDVAVKFLKMIGDRRLAMENLLEDMIFMDVPSRVVSLLLKYSDNDTIRIPFTHQEIADLTGSTRVSVSRAIAKLRRDGLIRTKGDTIRLINSEELRNIVKYSSRYAYS